MVEHVLVPTDGSDRAIRALEFALEEHQGANITLLTVINPDYFYHPFPDEGDTTTTYAHPDEVLENQEEFAEKIFEHTIEGANAEDAGIKTEYVVGRVARSIEEFIEDEDVDHVILGSHGRTGVSRILLGSVAEKVVRRSPVPVTIIR
ncbi:MAG: universal stress protein [Halodesulfurarchaeum sp.]